MTFKKQEHSIHAGFRVSFERFRPIGYLKAAKDEHLAAFFVVYAVISWQLYVTGDFVLVVVDATYS
jgi:hypothetical protein